MPLPGTRGELYLPRSSRFKSWTGSKAFFPPSQSLLNQASRVPSVWGEAFCHAKVGRGVRSHCQHSPLPLELTLLGSTVHGFQGGRQGCFYPPAGLARCLSLPSSCQHFCKKMAVAALVRCPSCMQPRYCSTKCRRMDIAHTTICGWKDPSNEVELPLKMCYSPYPYCYPVPRSGPSDP